MANIATTRQIAEEIKQTADSLEEESRSLGMTCVAMLLSRLDQAQITPEELFAKERHILDILKARGGFAQQEGRSLQIWFSQGSSVSRSRDIVAITCNMANSPEKLVDYIIDQAESTGFTLAA